jgi:hypothetical protein
VEDYCRACKTDRMHTVIAADEDGRPIRVSCGYCHSEHNYRGGPRVPVSARTSAPAQDRAVRQASFGEAARAVRAPGSSIQRSRTDREPFPVVSDRERTKPPMAIDQDTDIELLLRRIIREETGITAVVPSERWRGGSLVLRPGTAGLQEKSWPIETFFHKVVMLRNRLRTLEQQVNAAELPDDVKVRLQAYISGCYGTLTSFNVLFADEDDQFKGAAGD